MNEIVESKTSSRDRERDGYRDLALRVRRVTRPHASYAPKSWADELRKLDKEVGNWGAIVEAFDWSVRNECVPETCFAFRRQWKSLYAKYLASRELLRPEVKRVVDALLLSWTWARDDRDALPAVVARSIEACRAFVAQLRAVKLPTRRVGDARAILDFVGDPTHFVHWSWFDLARKWKRDEFRDVSAFAFRPDHRLFDVLVRRELHTRSGRDGEEYDEILRWLRVGGDRDGVSLEQLEAVERESRPVRVRPAAAPAPALCLPRPFAMRTPDNRWDE